LVLITGAYEFAVVWAWLPMPISFTTFQWISSNVGNNRTQPRCRMEQQSQSQQSNRKRMTVTCTNSSGLRQVCNSISDTRRGGKNIVSIGI